MTSTGQNSNKELALLIASHQDALIARLADEWAACLHTSVREARSLVSATLTQLMDALDTEEAGRIVDPFAAWAVERAAKGVDGLGPGGLLCLTHSLSRSLWDIVDAQGMTEAIAGRLRDLMDLIALAQTSAVDALVATQDARQRQTLYQEQQQQVRELSSPVIKVWEEVLVLPLVGTIDSDRAAQVMEDLLQGIVAHQAEVVIVDVTGVPVVDTYAVNYLMQTIKAAGLLGARSVLVGISAEVAQAMISLGVDLKGIETRGNLQAGIEFALQALHLQVVPTDGASFA
jgi:rsbT co-antagonist protein RsbR